MAVKLTVFLLVTLPDELAGFEESWNGNAQKHLPGWSGSFNGHDSIGKICLTAL